jgi:hypothetical protein
LYPNGTRIDETVPQTAIPNAATLRIGGRLGVGRDITVGSLGTLTPSLQIAYSPTPIRSGASWTDLRSTLGVALRLNADNLPDTVEDRRVLNIVDTLIARRFGERDADFVVSGSTRIEYDTTREGYFRTVTERRLRTDTLIMLSMSNELTSIVGSSGTQDKLVWKRISGKAKLDGPVVIDTLDVTKVSPENPLRQLGFTFDLTKSESIYMVLPVIFFEAGSAAIPSRYRQLLPQDALNFQEYDVATSQSDVYLNTLNIIGRRLRNTNEVITVHGYIDSVSDGNDCALALQRALSVRNYLATVCGVDSSRISVQWDATSCQPELISTRASAKGQHENRRVDITSGSINQSIPTCCTRRSVNDASA